MLWGGRETYNDNPLRARAMWQTQIIKLQQTFQEKKKGLLLQKKKKGNSHNLSSTLKHDMC